VLSNSNATNGWSLVTRVVAGFDHIRVAFGDVLFGSVAVGDVHGPLDGSAWWDWQLSVPATGLMPPTKQPGCGQRARFDATEIDDLHAGLSVRTSSADAKPFLTTPAM
jgi:hypothetical protein